MAVGRRELLRLRDHPPLARFEAAHIQFAAIYSRPLARMLARAWPLRRVRYPSDTGVKADIAGGQRSADFVAEGVNRLPNFDPLKVGLMRCSL
jgi:hypothetical protein